MKTRASLSGLLTCLLLIFCAPLLARSAASAQERLVEP